MPKGIQRRRVDLMGGRVKNDSHPADQIRVKMAAPALDKPKHALACSYAKEDPPCTEDLIASYRAWLKVYINDPKRVFGVYRTAGLGKWEIAFRNSPGRAAGLLRRCFARYTLFPRTTVPSPTFPPESEAMLNDWVVVGTDLFAAMQEYKIASHVAHPESAEHPTATCR